MKEIVTDPGCWVPIVGTLLFLVAVCIVFLPLYAVLLYFDTPDVDRILQSTPAESLQRTVILPAFDPAEAWKSEVRNSYELNAVAAGVYSEWVDVFEVEVQGQRAIWSYIQPNESITCKFVWLDDEGFLRVDQFAYDRATRSMVCKQCGGEAMTEPNIYYVIEKRPRTRWTCIHNYVYQVKDAALRDAQRWAQHYSSGAGTYADVRVVRYGCDARVIAEWWRTGERVL